MGYGEEKKPLLKSINGDDDGDDVISKPTVKESLIDKAKTAIKNSMTKETIRILVYVLLYIVSGVINCVLLKKIMIKFANYGFFLSQLTNYGYMPIFYLAMAYKLYFTKDIDAESKAFPQYKWIIMGFLDAISGFFVVIGGISTSGSLQQLLNQAIIPFTMIASFIFLKQRYSLVQLGGATVILGGVVVSLIPSLTGGNSTGNILFYNFFYLISVIPGALSNVYKDIAFQKIQNMDVWYLQFWDSLYQSLFGSILFPINNWLPPPATIKFDSILPAMKDGALCLGGRDSIVPQYFVNGTLTPLSCGVQVDSICDNCHNTWIIVLIYMTINIAYNIFILQVLKFGGATVYSIANTVILPLTNIVFSMKFIMGGATTPFSGLSIAGLLIILFGLFGYRIGSVLKSKKEDESKVDEESTKPTDNNNNNIDDDTDKPPPIEPKTQVYLRNQFFGKLGIDVPESRYRTSTSINY